MAQPPTPIQTYNTTAEGVVNNKIVTKKLKYIDLRLHWLRCREAQNKFRYYWDPGLINWGDYSTKHHPTDYHERNQAIHAGTSQ